jgi:hypothetical protein
VSRTESCSERITIVAADQWRIRVAVGGLCKTGYLKTLIEFSPQRRAPRKFDRRGSARKNESRCKNNGVSHFKMQAKRSTAVNIAALTMAKPLM